MTTIESRSIVVLTTHLARLNGLRLRREYVIIIIIIIIIELNKAPLTGAQRRRRTTMHDKKC